MKKLLTMLLVLVVLSAGCLGGGSNNATTEGGNTGTPVHTTSTQVSTTSPKKESSINPLKALEMIKQYTYEENATAELDIEMKTGNITQETNVSLVVYERGYVDLEGKRARIETRTTTLPDNVTLNTTWVIIGQKVYVEDFGNVTVENDTSFWKINPVSLARELLGLKPVGNYTENGTLVLTYSVPGELIIPLAELYFTTPDMNTTVTDATAELYFTKKGFIGMRLTYEIVATTTTAGLGGEISVRERGLWRGKIEITSVNEKKEVKAPPT